MLKSVGLFPRTFQAVGRTFSRPAVIASFQLCFTLALLTPAFGQLGDGLVGGVAHDSATGEPLEQVQLSPTIWEPVPIVPLSPALMATSQSRIWSLASTNLRP